jgi:SAM-dependent methyltransferase
MFNEKLSPYVKAKIEEYNFVYYEVTPEERDACIKKIVSALIDPNLIKAGEERYEQWEKGWSENLGKLTSKLDTESIIPHYFGKYSFVRINQRFIKPASKNFEYYSLCIILDWIFDKYIRDANSVYEFGCGTGYHLLRARKVNPTANLWGLDWTTASQEIIGKLAAKSDDSRLFARRFDYYNPDLDFTLEKDSIIYTVASLEQIGRSFEKFVDYLQENKPRLCIHIEPIAELLDANNLLDYLSIEYFKKRNYLQSFLDYLRELESKNKIKIIKVQRTYIGSLFIEGWSVVVWMPL